MADDRIANPWEKPARPVAPVYSGTAGRLFFLALRYMALTIVTFGIGRFWMATRLRQHYWSSVTIGDAPMEYTGRAKEKLIGFLIAVVILAAVLFVANLALALIGLLVFKQPFIAFQLSFIVLVPLGFWAQYRARRYIMARTRWRGIRFGVEPAAWGYAGAALGWWALVILTLGLLYPLMQLRLSRFLTDRSYFGDLRFEQKARLRPLFLSWMRVWAPLAVFLAWFVVFPLISGEELNEMYIDPPGYYAPPRHLPADLALVCSYRAQGVQLSLSCQHYHPRRGDEGACDDRDMGCDPDLRHWRYSDRPVRGRCCHGPRSYRLGNRRFRLFPRQP